MDPITIVGFIGATCTTVSFVPQAVKTIRTRHTKDISLNMYVLMFIGTLGWLAYGVLLKSAPIIVANTISIILSGIILGMKIKYK